MRGQWRQCGQPRERALASMRLGATPQLQVTPDSSSTRRLSCSAASDPAPPLAPDPHCIETTFAFGN